MSVYLSRLVAYCKELVLEFKKIKTPSRKEALLMSAGVLAVVCVIGLFLFLVDGLVLSLINVVIFGSL